MLAPGAAADADDALFTHLPLTSCCAGRFLTGHGPEPGVRDPCPRGSAEPSGETLTVSVRTHDAGVLPPQFQGHPLQVASGGGFFNQLANLQDTKRTRLKPGRGRMWPELSEQAQGLASSERLGAPRGSAQAPGASTLPPHSRKTPTSPEPWVSAAPLTGWSGGLSKAQRFARRCPAGWRPSQRRLGMVLPLLPAAGRSRWSEKGPFQPS